MSVVYTLMKRNLFFPSCTVITWMSDISLFNVPTGTCLSFSPLLPYMTGVHFLKRALCIGYISKTPEHTDLFWTFLGPICIPVKGEKKKSNNSSASETVNALPANC